MQRRSRKRDAAIALGGSILFLLTGHAVARSDDDALADEQVLRVMYAADRLQIESEGKFHLPLSGAWLYGPVSGHVQTPSGGRGGTSSADRPTFGEIGINTESLFDAEGTAEI